MKNKLILIIVSIAVLLSVYNTSVFTIEKTEEVNTVDTSQLSNMLSEDHVFTTMDKEGNVILMDIASMEEEVRKEIEDKYNMPTNIGNTTVIEYGVVNFKTKADSRVNTHYTDVHTGKSGYTNGYYAADGAFLGFNSDNTKVKFMLAGVTGWVSTSEVEILDYLDEKTVQSVSHYMVEDGKMYHYGTVDIKSPYYSMATRVGNKPSYLKEDVAYYSYDGHYFYEKYEDMITDYKNNTRENSVNKDTPYYNYYQFLSHRSISNFTKEMFDAYVNEKTGSRNSKMKNLGKDFVEVQNTYGVNAALMYAVAVNESAWGLSTIALNKNNLFGHGAVDSNPYYGSNGYESPSQSVLYHGKVFISEGYLDPCDSRNTQGQGYCDSLCLIGRYAGAHLGDKASGVNVQYASDPYWAEKATTVLWNMNDKYSSANDVNKYTIGIKNTNDSLNVRKEASTSSTRLYSTGKFMSYPFIILNEEEGSAVNNNKVWYKIQSDPTLKDDRSVLTQDKGEYNFDKYYGYVHSDYVDIVHTGNYEVESFDFDEYFKKCGFEIKEGYLHGIDRNIKPTDLITRLKSVDSSVTVTISTTSTYIEKDTVITFTASDNTKVSYPAFIEEAYDMNAFIKKAGLEVKNNYLYGININTTPTAFIDKLKTVDPSVKVNITCSTKNISTNTKITFTAYDKTEVSYHAVINADVNGDGNIYATDYVQIKNHIMGKTTLTGIYKEAADVNKDGKIYATDYVLIRNYIMGKGSL